MMRVLFVCSQNRLRSPTAERIFGERPDCEVASAGLARDAVNPLTAEQVAWADVIFVMERAHRNKLVKRFHAEARSIRIICLHIPDEYEFMEASLVDLLKVRVAPHLGAFQTHGSQASEGGSLE
jgi:predicted protein tyrosine phosphatase